MRNLMAAYFSLSCLLASLQATLHSTNPAKALGHRLVATRSGTKSPCHRGSMCIVHGSDDDDAGPIGGHQADTDSWKIELDWTPARTNKRSAAQRRVDIPLAILIGLLVLGVLLIDLNTLPDTLIGRLCHKLFGW